MATLSSVQKKSLERATLQYMEHIHEAEEYLEGRGIGLEVARSVAMGVVRNPIPGHEHLSGRLAIPYLTSNGPVNMTFRCLRDHNCKTDCAGKYMFLSGFKTNLYGVQFLEEADDFICIAEGEFDALASNMAGLPCVGISGAAKWEDHWSNIFEDFSRVYVWQEGDSAGKKFGDRIVKVVGAIRVPLPEKQDVNSLWVANGADDLRARIRS